MIVNHKNSNDVLVVAWSSAAMKEFDVKRRQYNCFDGVTEFHKTILSTQPVPLYPKNLVAVFVIIEAIALQQETFREFLRWCISHVREYEDFRFFVRLDDLELHNLQQRGADPLIGELLDTVQITENQDYSRFFSELDSFIKALPLIREATAFRHLQNKMDTVTGNIARWTECLAAAIVLLIGGYVFFFEEINLGWPSWSMAVVSVASGIIFTTLSIVGLFFLRRISSWHRLMHNSNFRLQFFATCFFLPWTLGLASRMQASSSWLWCGMALGLVLDYVRREGLAADKFGIKLNPDNVTTPGNTLPSHLAKMADGFAPKALNCLLFEQQRVKVFISYTRSSPWACQSALHLNQILKSSAVDTFLDQDVLVDGCNWRAQLNNYLLGCNVVIALVDNQSIFKPWPAIELETALQCRSINHFPDIIVLLKPGTVASDTAYPVFQNVLDGSHFQTNEQRPRIIEMDNQTIPSLVRAFERQSYSSSGVLPILLLSCLHMIFFPIIFLMNLIGNASPIIGYPVGLFVLADWVWNLDLFFHLSNPLRFTSSILIAYSVGFILRLIFAARYEYMVQHAQVLRMYVVGLIGLLALFYRFAINITPIQIAWAFITFFIGWLMGYSMLYFSFIGDPSRFRRKPE
ncbi:MAG: TIR domain-containing protein [Chlorobium sp.]